MATLRKNYTPWSGPAGLVETVVIVGSAPVLQSAAVSSDGMRIALTYSKTLDAASIPASAAFALGGTPATVAFATIAGAVVTLQLTSGVLQGAAVTVSYTPGGAPIQDPTGNDAAPLVAQAVTNGSAVPALDVADLAFRIDASNPATYAHTGGTLTSLTSTVSGTPLTTITAAPKFVTDPRDNKPAFSAAAVDGVRGSDATMQAAATGTNRAFTEVAVVEVTSVTSTGYWFSCNLSSGTDGLYFGQVNPNIRTSQGGAGGFISGFSEKIRAGKLVVTIRSPDGLTIYTSVNGGPETSVVVAAHGLKSPDRTGIFESVGSTPGGRFNGYLQEQLFYGVDKGAAATAEIAANLLAKWRPPPVIMPVGDSLTTATLVNNGGLIGLLAAAARADGLNFDFQGPTAMANGSGGAVWAPYKHSAASGNTCAQMQARVESNTTGLGLGGSSEGYYRNTRLVLLLAGTNDRNLTDYTTLLTAIGTRMAQHGLPNWRVAVTTIPEITGSEASVATFNAGLPAIWSAFEATFGAGTLLRWDAYACNGARSDGTHWTDAGYVTVFNHPTLGLYQAVKPYLVAIQ